MTGAGKGEAEAHFAVISGAGRQHQPGQDMGYRCPLPQVLKTASLHGVWVLLVPCVHRSSDFRRLAGFGRGGQGVKLVFSSFKRRRRKGTFILRIIPQLPDARRMHWAVERLQGDHQCTLCFTLEPESWEEVVGG